MIFFHRVFKSFYHHQVFKDLSLHIKKSKITFIIGGSGAGKSVIIKHIIGLMQPDSGQVIVDHQDMSTLSLRELRCQRLKFGMLFQQAALFDSLNVLENVSFPLKEHLKNSKKNIKNKVLESLEQVNLIGKINQLPAELSAGERKRVALARAIVTNPKILLYDEPTTGMDPLMSEMIDELIVELSAKNSDLTSVIISHDLKAALEIADCIIMLYQGQVVFSGAPKIFRETDQPVVRQFFSGRADGPMEFL